MLAWIFGTLEFPLPAQCHITSVHEVPAQNRPAPEADSRARSIYWKIVLPFPAHEEVALPKLEGKYATDICVMNAKRRNSIRLSALAPGFRADISTVHVVSRQVFVKHKPR